MTALQEKPNETILETQANKLEKSKRYRNNCIGTAALIIAQSYSYSAVFQNRSQRISGHIDYGTGKARTEFF